MVKRFRILMNTFSIKLSFENVFLFPRRHLYLIHILWIIEKHKYDKSAELRRIKSLWIGEWMDSLSPSQQNDFPIYIKPIKTNQRVLFSLAEGWPCWKKINLFFTISCNNEYFQVIHEVFKRTHFGTYLKIYILVNMKMKSHMTNTMYNLQKPILEMFQYLFISRLYALLSKRIYLSHRIFSQTFIMSSCQWLKIYIKSSKTLEDKI